MPVLIRIQHVAGRDHALNRLLQNLPPEVEVITDDGGPPPSPWRGYQMCLSDLPDEGHVCVLQDDTIVCNNFVPAVNVIAEQNSDEIVCLFLGGHPRRTAANVRQALITGRCYTYLAWHDFLPVVATMWPVHIAREFLTWAQENPARLPGGAVARSDDAVGGRWLKLTRRRARVAVPSLVEHPDDLPSTITRLGRNGVDRGRIAVQWIGEGDPLEINWTNTGHLTPAQIRGWR